MKTKPRILSRHIAARTRIFQVEALDLEFTNGQRRQYERILSARGSVMVVPLQGDTLLLTREYAAGFDRYELGFPKGVVDPQEDPADAANRELQEEIGFAARRIDHLQTVSLAPGYIQHVTHIHLARDLYEKHAEGDEPEPVELVPWPLGEADALLARPDFTEARAIAAIWLVRRFLAAGGRNETDLRGSGHSSQSS
jgi:ADP-ribose diphosphatase